MRKITLLLALLLLTQIFFSQEKLSDEKIQIGKSYEFVRVFAKKYFYTNNLILAVKTKKRGEIVYADSYVLQTFDANELSIIKSNEYDDIPKKCIEEAIIQLNDKIFLFYSLYDKKNKKEQLYAREIDIEKALFKGEAKMILEVDFKVTGTLVPSQHLMVVVDKYDFQLSLDESKLLVKYRKKPKIKNDSKNKDIIGLKVFDDNLNPIWAKEVTMPYTEKKMNNMDYAVDNEGIVYFATKVYRNNSTKEVFTQKTPGYDVAEINYDIEIMSVSKTGNLSQKKINLKTGKQINSIRLFVTLDGRVIAAGYYSSGGKSGKDLSGVNGVFKFDLTKDAVAYEVDYYDIPTEIINQNRSEKDIVKQEDKKEKFTFANLKPTILFPNTDGSFVIIGEQIEVYTYSSDGKLYTKYRYKDLLVTKINKDGTLAYMKKLPKRQRGNKVISYRLITGKDDIYIIYKGHIDNLDLNLTDIPKVANADLMVYKINYDKGTIKKTYLFDYRIVKDLNVYQFDMSRIVSTIDDEFVFEVYKKKKSNVLIRVELD